MLSHSHLKNVCNAEVVVLMVFHRGKDTALREAGWLPRATHIHLDILQADQCNGHCVLHWAWQTTSSCNYPLQSLVLRVTFGLTRSLLIQTKLPCCMHLSSAATFLHKVMCLANTTECAHHKVNVCTALATSHMPTLSQVKVAALYSRDLKSKCHIDAARHG